MKIHLTKPTAKQVRHFLIYCLIVVAGNFIASAASAYFIVPHEFVMGGTTGVGIFVRNLLPEGESTEWAVTVTVYIANIALFLVGAVFLGKRFAAATLAGTLLSIGLPLLLLEPCSTLLARLFSKIKVEFRKDRESGEPRGNDVLAKKRGGEPEESVFIGIND